MNLLVAGSENRQITKIYSDINTKKIVSPDQLYKNYDRKSVEATLQKLKKQNLVREFDINNVY